MGLQLVRLLNNPVNLTLEGGFNPRGEYDNAEEYVLSDVVSYLGSSYIAITTTTGNLPTDVDFWQILASKGDPGPSTVADDELFIQDDGDATKQGQFQLSGVTAGQTRILTWPNFNGTISTLAGTEALTNKTLTSPVINTGVSGTAIDTDGTMVANSDTLLASQKATKTYADAKVADAINNSTTTIAPSQNAVFDALALKSDTSHTHLLAAGATDVTASKDELNVLDGIPATLTATELGYVDGVTSAIQTQIDTKTTLAAVNAQNLSVFAATTSLQLKGVISDESGSGALVFADTPTLITPVLGVASATTINKVTITAPATNSVLTIQQGFTFTADETATISGFVRLAGRATPQTIAFGTAASANAGILTSTSSATKGSYNLTADGTMVIDELNSRIGIGVAPTAYIHIVGTQPANVGTTPGTAATDSFTVAGAIGGTTTIATTGTGGTGGDITFATGVGGVASSATTASTGGRAGIFTITGITGGAAAPAGGTKTGGVGSALSFNSGTGGAASGTGTNNGGNGGNAVMQSGIGGAATGGTTNNGGDGGNVNITARHGGAGATSAGTAGIINLSTGTTTTAATVKVAIGPLTVTLTDNVDIVVGSTNGTEIATATTQKLGFWGVTPVVQQVRPVTLANVITTGTTIGIWA